MEDYLQVVNHICEIHCRDVASFDSASLQRQLKELSSKFMSQRQLMSALGHVSPEVSSPSQMHVEVTHLEKEPSVQRENSGS
jgi:hypothetical protein